MRYLIMFCFFIFLSCNEKIKSKGNSNKTVDFIGIELDILNFDGLEPYLQRNDDKVYVVNFWATWCAPCVKELPHFEELNENYKDKNVEVILVSLDFPHQYDSKLKPYIKEHNLKSKIVVLDDVDMNTWIPKVNENWDGAIPVTIIYNKDKREFYDQTFTYETLENELKHFLK
ncbi:TlpA disulfide reductase family protein [Pontimicrobium sp. SW4]|uniref:TlpA disulfide reductase family protein n=1 Tax=Pontimicrobium sp. SW4 TaxID=3153519 RepID=A0AAU7BUV3_9FLAO